MPRKNSRSLPPRRRPLRERSANIPGPLPEEERQPIVEDIPDLPIDIEEIVEDIVETYTNEDNQESLPEEEEEGVEDFEGEKLDWVTRLRQLAQQPPKDLSHLLPNGEITINEENIARFNDKCTNIIASLKDWADDQTSPPPSGFWDRTMALTGLRVFQKFDLEEITRLFLRSVPDVVKTILGANHIHPIDLLDLPMVDRRFQLWGVYVDIAMEENTDQVVGVYVGSSIAYRTYIGISGRVRNHKAKARRVFEDLPVGDRSRHYETICREDVEPHFRVLALFEVKPGNSMPTIIAEEVMMLFLGTMPSGPPVQSQFARDIRADIEGIPDFNEYGLNRSLPLANPVRYMPRSQKLYKAWLKETKQSNRCFNCSRPGSEDYDDKDWSGWFEHRRCSVCYRYRYKHGEEKPQDLITDLEMHEIWVSQGHADECRNPACREPRNPEVDRNWCFYGPDMRCRTCSDYRRAHDGADAENPRRGYNRVKHDAWVAEGHNDVYGICFVPRPSNSHLHGWQGWLTSSRCPTCAYKPSEQEDAEWVEIYGDIYALCGVDKQFVRDIRYRCDQRRCNICYGFRNARQRDKTAEEIDQTSPALDREWLAAGNPDVCQECGKPRAAGGKGPNVKIVIWKQEE
ncbi:hypothetical protein FOQG_00335 [Fusarium oxysporum f. sp. raphani 54005]|uniref:Uncharacterized protein n=1 Tax=Fusarium oxysporum f. sp. raphani 54005 TaxID=1089458 RepID=X0D0N5_FUSOX|nr:hypothetical protein FOQG_00335 [Fusarium oxysporum f. sp. raphani 54005]